MEAVCINCLQSSPGVRNIRGDLVLERVLLQRSVLRSFEENTPIYLCQECIDDLQTESLSYFLDGSLKVDNKEQSITSVSSNSNSFLSDDIDRCDIRTQLTTDSKPPHEEKESTKAVKQRFKSEELNAIFAKPMPASVRMQKIAEIENIQAEDLEDKDVFYFLFYNRLKQQNKQRELKRLKKSLDRHNSSSRFSSNLSNFSPESPQSSMSMSMQSTPMGKSSDWSLPSFSISDDENAHSNKAAPRRIFNTKPAFPDPLIGVKTVGG